MSPEFPDGFEQVTEWLQHAPTVETVYGDPIEREDRTVVPVAEVRYGVAGGFGWGTEGRSNDQDESGGGAGGGGVGGARVTPIGALNVRDDGTEFVRFDKGVSRKRVVLAVVVSAALGLLFGRRKQD